MAENKNTENGTKTIKRPSHVAYSIRDRGEGKKARFTEIGVVFPHKDGKGFDVLLDVVPISGRVSIRTLEERTEQEA